MTITGKTSGELNIKRMYLDGVKLHYTCPECGESNGVYDFSESYLSYPTPNEPFDMEVFCVDCEHEFTTSLRLVVDLQEVQSKPVIQNVLDFYADKLDLTGSSAADLTAEAAAAAAEVVELFEFGDAPLADQLQAAVMATMLQTLCLQNGLT